MRVLRSIARSDAARNFSLAIGVFVLLLVLSEGAARLFYHPENLGSVIQFDRDLGWSLRPNSSEKSVDREHDLDYRVRINSLGLRERDIGLKKPAGKKRILFLGDSIVFGTGIDAGWRFSDIVARALGDDVDVVNAGVCGWGNDQELMFYEDRMRRLKPDVVVLTLTLNNDVVNNMIDHLFLESAPKPRFELHDGELVRVNCPLPPPRHSLMVDARRLLRHSRFLLFVKRRVELKVYGRRLQETTNHPPRGFDKAGLEKNYSHWSLYDKTYTGQFENAWELTEAIIRRFSEVCRADSAQLIVFAFPLEVEVNDPWRQNLLAQSGIDVSRLDFSRPYARLQAFCRENNVEFYYPLERFRKAIQRQPLYFERDSHPNHYGNVVAAEVLLDVLENHRFHVAVNPRDRADFESVH